MNILIMGCSFGVPNYFGAPGAPPQDHTEFILKDLGHNVINCAKNGGSNIESLIRARNCLSGNNIQHPAYNDQLINVPPGQAVDWIVWFHTELSRDRSRLQKRTFFIEKDNELTAEMTYNLYREFQIEIGAKLAVVGGAGDLHECFNKYFTPEFVIPSWRSHILGVGDITSHTLWQRDYIFNSNNSIKEKISAIDKDLVLKKLLEASPDFPDNCHPGAKPHHELVDKLQTLFQTIT